MDRTPEPTTNTHQAGAHASGGSPLPVFQPATAASRAGLRLAVAGARAIRPAASGGRPTVRTRAASWVAATGSGAGTFARALAARYGRLTGGPSPLDRTMLQLRPPLVLQPLHRRVMVQVAPRVTTTVQ